MEAKTIIDELSQLKSDRAGLNKELDEAAAFCCPEKYGLMSGVNSEQTQQPRHIIINEAVEANGVFKRGMFSNMCPPNSPWFKFEPENEKLMETGTVKDFYGKANSKFYTALMNSNFPLEINESFEDSGWCGTINLAIEPDVERFFRFTNHHISEYYCRENYLHQIDTVYREFKLTAAQAVEKFSRDDDDIQKAKKLTTAAGDPKKKHEKFTFIHFVEPNKNREYKDGKPSIRNKDKAWKSIYVAVEDKAIIRESGYDEMPFKVARLEKKAGQVYGYSPARRAMRAIKIGNKVWTTLLKAGEKAVDPPVMLNTAAYSTKSGLSPQFFFNPGQVNLYDGTQPHMEPQFQQVPANLPYGIEIFERVIKPIHSEFFVDMFQMINNLQGQQGRQRTAYEIMQLVSEKQAMIIPLVARLLEELFTPLLKSAWNIAMKAGLFGNVSPEIEEISMKITYTSPLALATRMSEINSFNDALNLMSPLFQLKPEVVDYIDEDKSAVKILDTVAVHPDFTRTQTEVDQIREARAKREAEKAQQEAVTEIAKSQNLTGKVEDNSIAGSAMENLTNG